MQRLKRFRWKQLVSGLLSLVMILSLLPATASAATGAPGTIKLINAKYGYLASGDSYSRYDSPHTSIDDAAFHTFTMDVNGVETVGMCMDHNKHLGVSYEGQVWEHPKLTTLPANVLRFLDYYYFKQDEHTKAHAETNTACTDAIDTDLKNGKYGDQHLNMWSRYDLEVSNSIFQDIVWLAIEGIITDPINNPDDQELIAQERKAILDQVVKKETTIEHSRDFVGWVLAAIGPDGFAPKRTYYEYSWREGQPNAYDGGRGIQRILVPVVETIDTFDTVYVKLSKVDEGGYPIPGVLFGVYADAAGKHQVGTITTGSGEWAVSTAIQVYKDTMGSKPTLYVKELSAPAPYKVDSTVHAVRTDVTLHDTPDKAAEVPGGPFVNTTIVREPEGVVQKIDADTNMGVGPATFRFVGQADDGSYIDKSFQCDENGSLDVNWWDPTADNYIPAGQYTVTEEVPPLGYDHTTESHHLVLVYDDVTGYTYNSGPIVFTNHKLHTIKIRKISADNKPLPGAVFEIYRNGALETTVITEADGTFTYDGPNGAGVEDGFYTIIEKEPPAGYLLPLINYTQFHVDSSKTTKDYVHEWTCKNYEYPEIIIKKLKSGTTVPLPGAEFEIKIDGKDFGTIETQNDGTIILSYEQYKDFLTPGKDSWTIQAREVTPPEGYLLDSNDWKTAELKAGQSLATLVFEDTPYPEILIAKRDRETKEYLPGCTFDIKIDGTEFAVQKTTGDDGLIHITHEDYGRFLSDIDKSANGWTVTVTEVTPPDKYNKDKQDATGDYTQTAQLAFGQSVVEFEFLDTSYRKIKVTKRDADTNWPLAGATFNLHCVSAENKDAGNIADRQLTTDPTGFVIFEDVPNGTYELTESTPPNGYESNNEKKTIVVTSGSDPVIEFEYKNEPKSGITIYKKDAVTEQPIEGAVFLIEPLSPLTDPSFERTADENGIIVLEDLPAGSYRITEQYVPEPYVVDAEPQVISINDQHDAYPVTFYNYAKGMLYIQKLDGVTSEPLAGAYFDIHTAGGTFVATVGPTGPNGYVTYSGLKPGGSYVVKEIRAPLGHELDPTPQAFEVSETDSGKIYTLIFDNMPKANLWLRKVDRETGVGLEGAVFTIRKISGEIVKQNAVTDHAGFIKVNNLEAGAYTAVEEKAPAGYILDSTEHIIHLRNDDTEVILIENVKPGSLSVRKVDASTKEPLAGAQFQLYSIDDAPIGQPKTSGLDGYVRWTDLEEGFYQVEEVAAPEGYERSTEIKKLEVKAFESVEYEWPNNQNTTITVVKRDAETLEPLGGAVFEIRDMNNAVVTSVTTGLDGSATTGRLDLGWYKVVEVKAPAGYALNSKEHLVEVKADTPVLVEVSNVSLKGIIIHKYDAVTKDALPGAWFELQTIDGKVVQKEFCTDESGTATTIPVAPGQYYLVETKAPDGYVLSEEKILIEVEEGASPTINVSNLPQSVIQIYKTDAVTGAPLSGVEFEIARSDGSVLETVFTDLNGWAYSQVVEPGEFLVREIRQATGYVLDPTVHRVTVSEGENAILRLTNAPDTSLHITKVDADTREVLAGAVFELSYDLGHGDCTYIGTYTSDEYGKIVTEPLTPGFYMLKEISAPANYQILEEEIRVCVKAGEYNEVVVENQKAATLIVRKIDSRTGQPIAGAVFKLETASHGLIGLMESDANGEAIFTGLSAGHYIVTETQAPPNYSISTAPQTITVVYGRDNYCDFVDAENGSLVVILQDKHTGEYLPGGQFIVTRESDQTIVFDASTDITGTLVVGNLLPGWYTVEQVFAPDGYTMIDVSTKVEILAGTQQTIYFKDETASLVIEKVDEKTPNIMLEGARFQVIRESDGIVMGEYVTDKSGLALVSGLTPGRYSILELVAPSGYIKSDEPKTVEVKGGTSAHVTFTNMPKSSITVNVVDKNTRQPIPGCVVEVWNQNGSLVNTFTSDSTGVIETLKLDEGYYVVKLIQAVNGYTAEVSQTTVQVIDGEEATYTFELVANGVLKVVSTNSSGGAIAGMHFTVTTIEGTYIGSYVTGQNGTYTFPSLNPGWYLVTADRAPEGHVLPSELEQRVEVKGNGTATVTFVHAQVFGLQIRTTCQQTGAQVSGVTYAITTMEGAAVGTYTSDAAGLISARLEPGWYIVTPKSAPSGYALTDTTPRPIHVLGDKLTVMDFVVSQMSSIRVKVVDGTTGRGIYGVRILLKNGSTSIQEYTTNSEGYITLDQTIVAGGYLLEMISAPGYIVDSMPRSIDVLNAQTTEITWKLYKDAGQIQVVVTSADYNKTRDLPAGTPLQGAVFEIMNPDTYQIVGQMISDTSGVAASAGLPIGRYIVKMVSAPAYYGLSSQEVEVRLKVNNDVVRTEFQVPSVNLGTMISQKTNNTVRAGSTMRVDILKADSSSDVRLDNFFMHIKVPSDVARITTLNPGTWNASVWYSISYRTNMNDYRLLAQNLQSTSRYSYDLSSQSLGLQAGEYVTDVRFEFGTVPAGFAMTNKTAYSLYILSTAYNGYKLINRLEVGGQHNTTILSTNHNVNINGATSGIAGTAGQAAISGNSGQWTTNASTWTTTITDGPSLPDTLPKTGY